MAIRKSDPRPPLQRQPVRADLPGPQQQDADVLHSRLQGSGTALALDDEFGGDPYNSTGRHTVLSKSNRGRQ